MRREECADDKMDSDRRRVVVHSHAAPKLQASWSTIHSSHHNWTSKSCFIEVVLSICSIHDHEIHPLELSPSSRNPS
jgi:hypothetical protein